MGRILALDYGAKRCGLAVTDPLKIIGAPLTTVETHVLMEFLSDYFLREEVELIVVGEPRRFNGEASEIELEIKPFIRKFTLNFPNIPVVRVDEMFTSKMAARSLWESGLPKKKRQDKKRLDSVSASLILQDYLNQLQ